ncbi:hypothetical protein [Pseudomonas oryzihabitans]|uniref:hypothetical protein n=1 Tax=Pseudomonas oryzihabitans TaxID=47885 RepID=UPI00123A6E45|nr:hypothetical protein [Pseudomonas oryzihabitans]QEU04474.1 hypothetical protein FOB65_14530 [Pseudomonas oryzihabitans]
MIQRCLPLALVALALLSLILGGLAPLRWQGLPAAGALLLLGLSVMGRLNARRRRRASGEHPPLAAPASRARLRADTPLHLLIASPAEQGRGQAERSGDHQQMLGFGQALAASGNELWLYGLDPELRLLAAGTAACRLTPAELPVRLPGATSDLRAALARLCRQARPGSVLVVAAPLDEELAVWLSRLDLVRRGLQLWLVDTARQQVAEPDDIRSWRDARRYADAWQARIQGERLAARLERRPVRRLAASATADLQTRLLQLWNAGDPDQAAD